VLGFFSSRLNWDRLTRRRVCLPPFVSRGDTLACGRWEGPNSDEGTDTGLLKIYMYFVARLNTFSGTKLPEYGVETKHEEELAKV
jgi:hypothetical protein